MQSNAGRSLPVLVALVLINGLVLLNAWLHNPWVGYDAADHLAYAETLAEGRLVGQEDSHEFFSPPLPYVVPALAMAVFGVDIDVAAKWAQFFNVLLSIGLTLILARLLQRRAGPSAAFVALLALGMLPVYYKSFAFVRGEPYVAFFAILVLAAIDGLRRGGFTTRGAIGLGVAMGLGALSRQWGILLFPAVAAWFGVTWLRQTAHRGRIVRAAAVAFAVTAAVGGWYYLSLQVRFDSMTAFNRPEASMEAASNIIWAPKADAIFGDDSLFQRPVRNTLRNQFLPILYAETWGDYWCYFSIYGIDQRSETVLQGLNLDRAIGDGPPPVWLDTNRESMSRFLGRVNALSMVPTAVALVSILSAFGVLLGIVRRPHQADGRPDTDDEPIGMPLEGLILLGVASTLAGYSWFVHSYPSFGGGDTVKATYLLHVYPMLTLLIGSEVARLRTRSVSAYRLLVAALLVIAIHNLPAMISQYTF